MTDHERRRLFRLAQQHGLLKFHWVAAQILGQIHGYDHAAEYVRQCMGKEKEANIEAPDAAAGGATD